MSVAPPANIIFLAFLPHRPRGLWVYLWNEPLAAPSLPAAWLMNLSLPVQLQPCTGRTGPKKSIVILLNIFSNSSCFANDKLDVLQTMVTFTKSSTKTLKWALLKHAKHAKAVFYKKKLTLSTFSMSPLCRKIFCEFIEVLCRSIFMFMSHDWCRSLIASQVFEARIFFCRHRFAPISISAIRRPAYKNAQLQKSRREVQDKAINDVSCSRRFSF